jgi:hypothetical protein
MADNDLTQLTSEKKPNRRARARSAVKRAFKALERRKKPPTPAAMRFRADVRAWKHEAMERDPNDLMWMLVPEDLSKAMVSADFAMAMIWPSDFAWWGEQLGMTVKEVRQERDRALARLEAAAHQLRAV